VDNRSRNVRSAAPAASFTVNTTADTDDANPGNTVCADSSGKCSLRAAITEANALVGADTITLPAGTYTLTIGGTGENANATGDLDITGDLTINGSGPTNTTIDGGATDRVLHVHGGVTAELSGVTITNGRAPDAPDGSDGSDGGGIANGGTLAFYNTTVASNTTGKGGGCSAMAETAAASPTQAQ
jgi:CSLREA domain-containing protein